MNNFSDKTINKLNKTRIAELCMKNREYYSAISCFIDIKNNFDYDSNIDFRIVDAYIHLNDFTSAKEVLKKVKIKNSDQVQKFNYRNDIILSQLSNTFQASIKELDSKFHLLNWEPQINSKASDLQNVTLTFSSPIKIDFLIINNSEKTKLIFDPNLVVVPYLEEEAENKFVYSFKANLLSAKFIGIIINNNLNNISWIFQTYLQRNLKVLKGLDNWLFLDNDSNSSPNQFKGEIQIAPEELKNWEEYLTYLSTLSNIVLLIPPSKEQVYSQFYPFKRGKICPIDQLLAITQNLNNQNQVIYPLEDLKKITNSYSKTDTHWSALGAMKVIYNLVNKQLGSAINEKDSKLNFSASNSLGDLGSKCQPFQSSEFYRLENFDLGNIIFTNFLEKQGSIFKIFNPSSILDKSILIFGDSFTSIVKSIFNEIFRTTIIVRSNATIIKELVAIENPDLIICEITERFIIKAPHICNNIWDYKPCIRLDISDTTKSKILHFNHSSKNNVYTDYISYFKKHLEHNK